MVSEKLTPEMPDSGVESRENMSTTYIDFVRHGNRFGGKIKVEIDGEEYEFDDSQEITPEGEEVAKDFGLEYPDEVTLVHPRGASLRHGQTGEEVVEASGKFGNKLDEDGEWVPREEAAPVLMDGKVKGSRKGAGVDYKESGMDLTMFKRVKGMIAEKLNEIVNALPPEEKQAFVDPANGELRAKYREQAQLVGLEEAMKATEDMEIAAQNQAMELMHAIRLSRRGVKDGETKAIPIVGSGLFSESLLQRALVIEDEATGEKKLGFDDVSEMGGFIKQATAFRIKALRKMDAGIGHDFVDEIEDDTQFEYEFTDPEQAEAFEGKKIYLDWDKVRELAAEAEERFKK